MALLALLALLRDDLVQVLVDAVDRRALRDALARRGRSAAGGSEAERERFAAALAEIGSVEKAAKLEGRNMLMFLAPKAAK